MKEYLVTTRVGYPVSSTQDSRVEVYSTLEAALSATLTLVARGERHFNITFEKFKPINPKDALVGHWVGKGDHKNCSFTIEKRDLVAPITHLTEVRQEPRANDWESFQKSCSHRNGFDGYTECCVDCGVNQYSIKTKYVDPLKEVQKRCKHERGFDGYTECCFQCGKNRYDD